MIRMLLSRVFTDRSVWLLPVAGFALTSGIGLMVFGGAMYFYRLQDPWLADVYFVYATAALILLVIPMLALMHSAARLLARRRDERLAALRLLGAGSGQLRRLVLAEAGTLAAAGIAGGALLYTALMPAVGLLPFAGSPMGVDGLWLGPGLLAAACAVLVVFAFAAALTGLRRVEITPLGVRTRQVSQKVWWGRAVVALAGVVVVFVLYVFVPVPNELLAAVVGFAFLAVPLLAVQLVGPWVLKLVTLIHHRRAKTAERLVAARNVLEAPQQMWRQVGGVAVAAFIGVIAGCGMALVGAANPEYMGEEDLMLLGDVQRGVWLTLAVAFLMTACSVGLNQTAEILDRRQLYSGLAAMGFSLSHLSRIRILSVMRSLAAVLLIAVGAACVVALPIVGAAALTAPVAVATVALVLVAGVVMIRGGMSATTPTLRSVAFSHR
ncbi:FtsX-like permease family protein [Nesterenkonia alba]|uniref:FtsX-like permease family protein n=1 Tax=Nesterenkonia alba TaxID=515814 RepID=UPI0003B6003A|nr:FtsX-like permease family protein [Nesterenkonia alba]